MTHLGGDPAPYCSVCPPVSQGVLVANFTQNSRWFGNVNCSASPGDTADGAAELPRSTVTTFGTPTFTASVRLHPKKPRARAKQLEVIKRYVMVYHPFRSSLGGGS